MPVADTRPFHFRQFSLFHHRSTMKVGTDAVLLGVWTPVEGVKTVLDIGTGCGILTLLLAARDSALQADAVEIDPASCAEAQDNFRQSPFAGRLRLFCSAVEDFRKGERPSYDLVISNPPFFINDHRSPHKPRRLARHADTLPYDRLIASVVRLLHPAGRFAVVLPYRESGYFLRLAAEAGLQLQQRMLIFPKPCREPNRVNLLLGFENGPVKEQKLMIRDENGVLTPQYTDMVKNYYLST